MSLPTSPAWCWQHRRAATALQPRREAARRPDGPAVRPLAHAGEVPRARDRRPGAVPDLFLRYRLLPQVIANGWWNVCWLLYALKPAWSYRLNADFEDHAEHEYAALVEENPQFETTPYVSALCAEYGTFASLADLFRQIGHDERCHKRESEQHLLQPRVR